jgi:hypothetical protein
MSKPLWTFEGYVTNAGNRVVQKWYWKGIEIDDRDDVRIRTSFLGGLQRNLWKEPHFKWFGDIGEYRQTTPVGALRIYGYFPEERPAVFVFLCGVVKKSKKDNEGIDTARLRLKRLKQGIGGTHEFQFEEEPAGKDSSEQGDEDAPSIQ